MKAKGEHLSHWLRGSEGCWKLLDTADGYAMIGLGGKKRQESIGLVLESNGSASKTDVLVE